VRLERLTEPPFILDEQVVVVFDHRTKMLDRVVRARTVTVLPRVVGVGNVLAATLFEDDNKIVDQIQAIAAEVADPDFSPAALQNALQQSDDLALKGSVMARGQLLQSLDEGIREISRDDIDAHGLILA